MPFSRCFHDSCEALTENNDAMPLVRSRHSPDCGSFQLAGGDVEGGDLFAGCRVTDFVAAQIANQLDIVDEHTHGLILLRIQSTCPTPCRTSSSRMRSTETAGRSAHPERRGWCGRERREQHGSAANRRREPERGGDAESRTERGLVRSARGRNLAVSAILPSAQPPNYSVSFFHTSMVTSAFPPVSSVSSPAGRRHVQERNAVGLPCRRLARGFVSQSVKQALHRFPVARNRRLLVIG